MDTQKDRKEEGFESRPSRARAAEKLRMSAAESLEPVLRSVDASSLSDFERNHAKGALSAFVNGPVLAGILAALMDLG